MLCQILAYCYKINAKVANYVQPFEFDSQLAIVFSLPTQYRSHKALYIVASWIGTIKCEDHINSHQLMLEIHTMLYHLHGVNIQLTLIQNPFIDNL